MRIQQVLFYTVCGVFGDIKAVTNPNPRRTNSYKFQVQEESKIHGEGLPKNYVRSRKYNQKGKLPLWGLCGHDLVDLALDCRSGIWYERAQSWLHLI